MDVYDAIPTCAARVLFLRHNECLLTIGLKEYPFFSPLFMLITRQFGKAENKNIKLVCTQRLLIREFCYGQVNELDTLKWLISRQYTSIRISNFICNCFKRIVGIFLKANTLHTTSIRFNQCKDLKQNKNSDIMLLRDLTASSSKLVPQGIGQYLARMRRRSFHSSCAVSYLAVKIKERITKGNILESKSLVTKVLEKNVSAHPLYLVNKKARATYFLITLVRKELQLYKNKQNVYNGLIDILNKSEFLIACYQEISQKEVGGCNKQQPFTDYKINSVDREWFVNLSNSLVTGKFNFSKLVNSPLEYKIVKKALATIIEEIWESISSDNSHRPNRSEHHALKTIYLYGGYYPWVIHGYFTKDSFSNEIIMNCIKKIIKCPTMVELIQKALKAGYIEQLFGSNKSFLAEISDSFVIRNVSPLLCNIVLNEFDNYMVILKSTFTVSSLLLDKYNRNITLPRFGKYTNLDKLLYIRYGNEFVIFMETKLDTAKHIRLRIKNFLQTKGLSLNMERFVIKNTVQGFSFLGASCKRYFVKIRPYGGIESIRINNSFGLSLKTKMTRIRINIDLRKIYKKLVDSKYARFSNHSQKVPLGTAKNSILNLSHADIIELYNLRVIKLINFYSFAANRHKLKNIIWLLHISCALTLAKKYKIRSKSLIFKRFGRSLACPETGVKLYIFKSLKAIHDYRPNAKVNIYFPYTKNRSNIFNSHIINNNNRNSIISSRGFLSRGKIFYSGGLPAVRARINNIQ